MSEAWLTIAGLAGATVAIKASGPLAVGAREPSPRALRVIALLAPALLTALVAIETFGADGRLTLDARAVGLAAAAGALVLRAPLVVCVVAAALAAAGARALA